MTILLFLLFSSVAFASHIVGGEIIYDYLGNNNYRITLNIYRDCTTSVPFDGTGGTSAPAVITVYDASNNLIGVYDIGAPVITSVPPAFNNPCIQAPNTVCVEQGVYTYTLTLPPQAGGYTVIYQRCCRNAGVANLVNSGEQGSTYFTNIPGPELAATNSSPRFSKFPPIYICQNVRFRFDHSAADPDGDQLVYSLCAPFAGLDGCCGYIGANPAPSALGCVSPPSSCPSAATPPPYTSVLFLSPYTGSYPIDSSPAFSINPVTGELSGTPTVTALYVVGVQVQEYRNNVLLSTHFRDFQFTVLNCTVSVQSGIADQKQQCQGQTISFVNQSINNSSFPVYHWDFGVPSLSNDTSNLLSPTYVYPDTGIYVVSLITNPGKPCTDTLKKQVYVYPPLKISFPEPARQCFRNNSFSFNTAGMYTQQTKYFWDFTASATPSTSTLKNPGGIHFTQGGLYFVKLKAAQFSCVDSFIDTVRVIRRPQARINNIQTGLCNPATVGFSNGSSSDLPVTYAWSFSNGQSSTQFEPVQTFSPAGTYVATLVVQTTQVCRDTSIAILSNILVNPRPLAAFTFSPREASIFEPEITIRSTAGDDVTNTLFYFGDGKNSTTQQNVHTYANYGTFRITEIVTNGYGCVDSTSDLVKILPEFRFWVPNTFTPDGNALNDFFLPVAIGIEQYHFEIFDRWGASIFKTTNLNEGWNGSYKGKECQQDIYVWKISFKNVATEQTETHFGYVTLLRNP